MGVRLPALRLHLAALARDALEGARRRRLHRRRHRSHHLAERRRFFRFDPFAHIARGDATVAALRARATDVNVSETSKAEYRRRWDEAHAAA